ELVASIHGADKDRFKVKTKYGLGSRNGDLAFCFGYSGADLEAIRLAFLSRGAIHQVVRGHFENQTVHLDGKVFIEASLIRCLLITESADFARVGGAFVDCTVSVGPRVY